ncbi:uncharacterized protein LOC131230409 isoform X3 [Magnolia sinica]|uniref:uncharacterized protein LOC131230409 isoform X3 n=1 Tax=Magnolia sinica TaxID=86752 RepID=UPI00265ACAF3|nr:uncharacterized protein LOC131230409 isoform X3 [Magnolia sinica]
MNQNNSSSSSNPCPICLHSINQEAYLDRCFHKFCYDCIAHWSQWVASQSRNSNSSLQCPLCKVENFSIIHGCDGDSFQQHYINQDLERGFSFSEAHRYRLQCYYGEPVVIDDKFNVLRYWKCHKYLQPNQWLQSWLRREIQALVQLFIPLKPVFRIWPCKMAETSTEHHAQTIARIDVRFGGFAAPTWPTRAKKPIWEGGPSSQVRPAHLCTCVSPGAPSARGSYFWK